MPRVHRSSTAGSTLSAREPVAGPLTSAAEERAAVPDEALAECAAAAGAGANVMVAGTFVFRNSNGADWAIKQLHDAQSDLDAALARMK